MNSTIQIDPSRVNFIVSASSYVNMSNRTTRFRCARAADLPRTSDTSWRGVRPHPRRVAVRAVPRFADRPARCQGADNTRHLSPTVRTCADRVHDFLAEPLRLLALRGVQTCDRSVQAQFAKQITKEDPI